MDNETTSESDYYYYERLSYTYPLILLISGFFVMGTSLSCFPMSIICSRIWRRSKSALKHFCQLSVREFALRINEFLLFDFRHERPSQDLDTGEIFSIYGTPIHYWAIVTIAITMSPVVLNSLVVFWQAFAIDSTIDQCDLGYDCFLLHSANLTPISSEPIERCDMYVPSDNTTLRCFRLVQRYSQGFAEAGGFLFFMQVCTNALIYVYLKVPRLIMRIHIFCTYRIYHRSPPAIRYNSCLSEFYLKALQHYLWLLLG